MSWSVEKAGKRELVAKAMAEEIAKAVTLLRASGTSRGLQEAADAEAAAMLVATLLGPSEGASRFVRAIAKGDRFALAGASVIVDVEPLVLLLEDEPAQ